MNRKILVVSRNFWPEDVRITNLCEDLVRQGFRVDVLCGQPSDSSGEFVRGYNSYKIRRESHEKLDIYRTVDVKRSGGSNLRIFLYYISFPLTASFLVKKLSGKNYEAVLICQYSPVMSAGPGLAIAKKLGIPAYIYIADLWPEKVFDVIDVQSSVFKKFLFKLSDSYYKKSDFLIVPTEQIKKQLTQRLFMENSRIYVVPRSAQDEFCCEIRDDNLLEKMAGSFNIVIFSQPQTKLDVDSLVKAALLTRDSVRSIRFIVIGSDERVKMLEDRVNRNGLRDSFYFEGNVKKEDTGKYIHLADVMLLSVVPGETEEKDVPQMFINYLASARPVIASCEGAVKEILKEAKCGISAAPSDGDNLYSCFLKIYQLSKREREEMGRNAKIYQLKHFDCGTNAALTGDILNGIQIDKTSDDSGIKKISEM